MSITPDEKTRLMKEFATKEGDTGSPEVQAPQAAGLREGQG